MRKDEADCAHVRLDKKNSTKLRKITRETHRSLTSETNLAVEQYKHQIFVTTVEELVPRGDNTGVSDAQIRALEGALQSLKKEKDKTT